MSIVVVLIVIGALWNRHIVARQARARIVAVEKVLKDAGAAKATGDWLRVNELLDKLDVNTDEVGVESARLTKAKNDLLRQALDNLLSKMMSADLGGGVKLDFMPIKAGSFEMGSNSGGWDEKPVHRVTLTKPFWMGRTEVTQGQYEKIMGSNLSHFKGGNNPVERVSWNKAVEFCRKLTEVERKSGRLLSGYEYRLPTEAEWEYCCRAGTTGDHAGSLDAMGWYRSNSG